MHLAAALPSCRLATASLINYHRPARSQTSQFTRLANAPYRQKYETFQNIKSKDILYNEPAHSPHTMFMGRMDVLSLCLDLQKHFTAELQQAIGGKLLHWYIQIL